MTFYFNCQTNYHIYIEIQLSIAGLNSGQEWYEKYMSQFTTVINLCFNFGTWRPRLDDNYVLNFHCRPKVQQYGWLHLAETLPVCLLVHSTTSHLRVSMWLLPQLRLAMAPLRASITLHKEWRQQPFIHCYNNPRQWLEELIW